MAKLATQFVCQNCGAAYLKWVGRCEACGEWNTVVEETAPAGQAPGGLKGKRKGRHIAFESLAGASEPPPRLTTGIGRRLGHPAGRRSRRRQVDHRASGRGASGDPGRAMPLSLR